MLGFWGVPLFPNKSALNLAQTGWYLKQNLRKRSAKVPSLFPRKIWLQHAATEQDYEIIDLYKFQLSRFNPNFIQT